MDFRWSLVQTAWFVMLIVQTTLVSVNRIDVHRRLGIFGALLAVAVVGLSFATMLGLPGHFKTGQLSIDAPFDLEAISAIFWNDLGSLLIFGILVATAISLRRRTETDKRLMLLASIRISGPAVVRIGMLPGSWLNPMFAPPIQVRFTAIVVGIVLPLSLVAYDFLVRRRLHPATLAGILLSLAITIASVAMATSQEGRALVIALE